MYKLLLMTPDGEDYVVEGSNLTLEQAEELSANMGARWIFYPLHFIIKDHGDGQVHLKQRIIETGEELTWAANKTVGKVISMLKQEPIIINY